MLDKGTIISKRYQIIEKLGAGGMAVAYKARDMRLGRFVTVKVLKDEYSENADFLTKFSAEASAAASLSHHNIVRVYDVGEDRGINYIVMEYTHGQSLKEAIKEKAPFDSVTTLSVAMQIASALSYAHKHHVVHRDIKPQNILVAVDGTVKVTDFGIARAASSSTYAADVNAMGSIHYFSPEQARGGFVNEKSDIYSLGITMYEMATGRVPFDASSSIAVALKHLNEELPDIRQYNPDITRGLEGIIRKATQKNSDERYDNIDILLSDIKLAIVEAVREKGGKGKAANNNVKAENKAADAAKAATAAAVGAKAANDIYDAKTAETAESAVNDETGEIEIPNSVKNGRRVNNIPEDTAEELASDETMVQPRVKKHAAEEDWDDDYDTAPIPKTGNTFGDYEEDYDDEFSNVSDDDDDDIKVELASDLSKIKLPKSSVGFGKYKNKLKLNNDNDEYDDDDDYDDYDDDEEYDDDFDDYYEEYDEEKRQEKKVTIAAVITSLVIIAVIVFVGVKYFNVFGNMQGLISKNDTSTVPLFIDMDYDEASAEAEKLGIKLVKGAEVEGGDKKNVILTQDIEAGSEITKDMEIIVTVSAGADTSELPNVVGKDESVAISTITKALPNANIILEYKSDSTHSEGEVISMSPEGGSQVTESVSVTLTICRDSSSLNAVVPNVAGYSESDAIDKINESGLSVGNISRINSNSVAKGYVITQTAEPGEEILKTSTIDIVVSLGRGAQTTTNNNTTSGGSTSGGSTSGGNTYGGTTSSGGSTSSGTVNNSSSTPDTNEGGGTNVDDDVPALGSGEIGGTNSDNAPSETGSTETSAE